MGEIHWATDRVDRTLPRVADISYFEAWQLWLDGRSTVGNDLLGLPMIWWGRAGKILSFISGAAILVDLLGPEKLARYGTRLTWLMEKRVLGLNPGPMLAGALTGIPALAITDHIGMPWLPQMLLVIALGIGASILLAALGAAMADTRLAMVTRWTSLALFVIGFHFDLLAS
ncbi:hypothetical protein ACIBQX_43790 [Nonomuraea sp. NPDC049714]|uniref:hypothetical protein n=1 Tax=Nonomuraea sp. NPDC049714 TaxID=3364357 RepID=UPI00379AD60A